MRKINTSSNFGNYLKYWKFIEWTQLITLLVVVDCDVYHDDDDDDDDDEDDDDDAGEVLCEAGGCSRLENNIVNCHRHYHFYDDHENHDDYDDWYDDDEYSDDDDNDETPCLWC